MSAASYPVVVAAPEMSLAEVVARSSARIGGPRGAHGRGAAQALQLHTFEFADRARGFRLSPGRCTLMGVEDGRIVSVRVSPHLEYLSAGQGEELLARCSESLEAVGWSRTSSDSPARALAVVRYAGEAVAGSWRAAEWAAELRLRRVHAVDSPIARMFGFTEDMHLVTLSLSHLCREVGAARG